MDDDVFEEMLIKIKRIAGVRKQKELADILGISPSAISDAKTRGKIPDSWTETLEKKFGPEIRQVVKGSSGVIQAGTSITGTTVGSGTGNPDLDKLFELLQEYASPAEIKHLIKQYETKRDELNKGAGSNESGDPEQ